VGEKREREPQRDNGDKGSGGGDAKVFQCKACAGTFVSRNALFKHMRSAAHCCVHSRRSTQGSTDQVKAGVMNE